MRAWCFQAYRLLYQTGRSPLLAFLCAPLRLWGVYFTDTGLNGGSAGTDSNQRRLFECVAGSSAAHL
jgi:hypothetical protein